MDTQTTINAMIGLIMFLLMWAMNSFRTQLNDNKVDIAITRDKVRDVEVLVAGKYVTRDELAEHTKIVLDKLDIIQLDIRSCMLHSHRKDDVCEP